MGGTGGEGPGEGGTGAICTGNERNGYTLVKLKGQNKVQMKTIFFEFTKYVNKNIESHILILG